MIVISYSRATFFLPRFWEGGCIHLQLDRFCQTFQHKSVSAFVKDQDTFLLCSRRIAFKLDLVVIIVSGLQIQRHL